MTRRPFPCPQGGGLPPPSFTGPTGGRVCPARRGGYHPPASIGATCGRPSAGVPPGTRPMGPPRRPNGVVVVGRGGPAEGMSFRACPEANDPQLGPTTAPPFLPEEMGGKKGRGAPPTLNPPVRGLMAAVGCTDRAKTGPTLPQVFQAASSQALPRLGRHASGLPCKPRKLLRCTGLARRAAVGAVPLKYQGSRGNCPWGATTRRAVRRGDLWSPG